MSEKVTQRDARWLRSSFIQNILSCAVPEQRDEYYNKFVTSSDLEELCSERLISRINLNFDKTLDSLIMNAKYHHDTVLSTI